jgi:acetyl esterase/lipase
MTAFLDAVRSLPPEYEVAPGLTAAAFADFYGDLTVPEGAVVETVTYGTAGDRGRPLTMHLCRRADASERVPGVVFIHGGGWRQGDPFLHLRHLLHLAAHGFVGASIAFRQSDEAPFPAAVEDAKCAVRWMRSHAAEIGLDPGRLAVAGGSSGGHLAALVAATPGRFEGRGGWADTSSEVNAAVLWYPPTDLLEVVAGAERTDELEQFLGVLSPERCEEASPLHQLTEACPPVLTMTGSADELVPVGGVERFHEELSRLGVPNELEVYEGLGHSFDLLPVHWQGCFDRMLEFLERHLCPAGRGASG